ncbi:unnamed protein product [Cutaneotrichosporon oleaginosum]
MQLQYCLISLDCLAAPRRTFVHQGPGPNISADRWINQTACSTVWEHVRPHDQISLPSMRAAAIPHHAAWVPGRTSVNACRNAPSPGGLTPRRRLTWYIRRKAATAPHNGRAFTDPGGGMGDGPRWVMFDPSGVQSSHPLCHICRQPKCHSRSDSEDAPKNCEPIGHRNQSLRGQGPGTSLMDITT